MTGRTDEADPRGRVLVTGAGGGIGQAVASLLSERGTDIALASRTERSVRAAAGALIGDQPPPILLWGDLGDALEADRVVGEAAEELGRLDAVIHCAGRFERSAALELAPVVFEDTVRTNLYASFYVARAAAQVMIHAQRGGRIILVSSLWAARGGQGRAAYCASKAGVEALAGVLAAEWSSFNIDVYCVAPGWVATPRTLELISTRELDEERLAAVAPSRALLAPREVATLLIQLADGEHPMLAGTAIRLDGGVTNWIGLV